MHAENLSYDGSDRRACSVFVFKIMVSIHIAFSGILIGLLSIRRLDEMKQHRVIQLAKIYQEEFR